MQGGRELARAREIDGLVHSLFTITDAEELRAVTAPTASD